MAEVERGKILIVEDEAVTGLDLEEMLVGDGYQVAGAAASAKQALELVEREIPDLALLDITIAGSIDGIVLGGILQQRYDLAHVYLTAHTEPEVRKRASTTSPLGYIVKPFSDQELLAGVRVACCRKETKCKAVPIDRQPFVVDQHFPLIRKASSACPMQEVCLQHACG